LTGLFQASVIPSVSRGSSDGPGRARGDCALHRPLDDPRDQNRRPTKRLEEMPIDFAGSSGVGRATSVLVRIQGRSRRRVRGWSTNQRARAPYAPSPRVRPTTLAPRSLSTVLPSTPKVSVAGMQVVMPGRVGRSRSQACIDERSFGQQQPPPPQYPRLRRGRARGAKGR